MTFIGDFSKLPDSKLPKRDLIYFLVFILLLLSFVFIKNKWDNYLLIDSNEVTAVLVKKSTVYLGGKNLIFEYIIDGKTISSNVVKNDVCFDRLLVGDSIKIKYSVNSIRTVEILDCQPLNRKIYR